VLVASVTVLGTSLSGSYT